MKKLLILFLILSTVLFGFKYQSEAFKYLDFLSSGEYEKAYEISNDIMKKQLSAKRLENIWKEMEMVFGEYMGYKKFDSLIKGEYEVYIFHCEYERAFLDIIVSVDKDGKIAGLFFRKSKEKVEYRIPNYVDESKFVEKEIKIGKWKLPGKITIPKGEGKFPAVILIHGSGPNDMDESIGPNKVFKDIAYGLSTKGIVVLRFDKRTYRYARKIDINKITIKEEIIEDVESAMEYLKKQEFVKEIYLLGHSLGAYIAPYIAFKNKEEIKGVILLASPARNLEDLMIDQLNYLKRFEDIDETLIEELKKLKRNELSEEKQIMGATARYYYDLRKYNPLNYLKNIKAFLLFGERDYQVTSKDVEIFKEKIKGIKIKVYPKLNHLFMKGEGDPNPYEYFKEGHVSEEVIEDIVKWIKEEEK